ncbi:2-methylaconitate cis-trans isomerase PrpF family protein [Paracoccus sp. (in: a-proteobacteria)]|uniref:2-methylaconitate cis-trans isomerase PrpF family protein n=1 Tax=Paracoccus sp. TaxID=267 RepID=UPI002AFFB39C|nr:PrpF domain-containing protein [Paracoccus sp. (in: a-proteobacteria)]
MTVRSVPAQFWRGGTSKALVFNAADIPEGDAARSALFKAAMGSPDDYGRQLDGMGGGISSLSKICILGPSSHPEADVDYTFGQVPVGAGEVDFSGNCGNMSSAMGPAALAMGLVGPFTDGRASVRVHNTNTAKVIIVHFAVKDGQHDPSGDFVLDGVSGTASPVELEFLDPAGAKTGTLLPTGRALDRVRLADGGEIEISCIDAANPCVFVAAESLGKAGTELPEALEADTEFLARIEEIRQEASLIMGLASDKASAAAAQSLPKIAMVHPPRRYETLSAKGLEAEEYAIGIRMMSMGRPHRAVPVTGAVCLAIAARIEGSIPATVLAEPAAGFVIGHPSGSLSVDAKVVAEAGSVRAISGTVYRTARKLFSGEVWLK